MTCLTWLLAKTVNLLGMNLWQLEYFETILHPYLTQDASESLKSLQGVLLEKATESVTESVENLGHHRRSTRGSEDALADDRQQVMSVSPDDLIVRTCPFCVPFVVFLNVNEYLQVKLHFVFFRTSFVRFGKNKG